MQRIPIYILGLFLIFVSNIQAQEHDAIKDIIAEFNKVNTQSEKIRFSKRGFKIPQKGGHYQGVQVKQYNNGERYAFISGSSAEISYYFTIALGETNKVLAYQEIQPKPMIHAGGFQIIQDKLFVGIEDDKARTISNISVYDISRPENTNQAPILTIERKGLYQKATAGAVAITDYENKHLLFVGTWDNATIDIYWSNGKPLSDSNCTFLQEKTWVANDANKTNWLTPTYGSYQNMNFIKQQDGKLFLLAFCETAEEKNIADLYEVTPTSDAPINQWLVKKASKTFNCQKTSFKSGSGVFITPQGQMEIYSCAHQGNILELFSSD